MGWSITLPGKEINTTNIFFTQTSSEDYEEFGKLNVLGLAYPPTGAQAVVYEEFMEQLQKSNEGWNETWLPWKREPLSLGN